jgi:hypothetical protein
MKHHNGGVLFGFVEVFKGGGTRPTTQSIAVAWDLNTLLHISS